MAGSKKAVPTEGLLPESIAPFEQKSDEEYMGPRMREHFKNILLAQKNEIMQAVDDTVNDMRNYVERLADPADRAFEEETRGLELRTRNREGKLLRKIEQTLEAIDNDDYGFCESCGVEIGLRRLEARPTATLCIDCKTLAEIREKQQGG